MDIWIWLWYVVIKELKNNDKKWNVSFVEFDVKNFVKEGDIVKGKLFIQYVCESLKVDSELRAVQPFPKSPHIEAVVRVVKHINSYSLLVESAISDSEILVEFENDVTYEKDDVIFFWRWTFVWIFIRKYFEWELKRNLGMKKWEAIAFQEFSQWFMLDVDNKGNWMFTDLTIGTFMQPLKDTKEYWIFFVEMIYKLYKCNMIRFVDGENPIRLLVGNDLDNLEDFWCDTIEDFCNLLASRYKYRKSDVGYQPWIYPVGKYQEIIRKYEREMDYISFDIDESEADKEIKNFKINENFINEIEKIFEESGVEWKDKEKFLGKEKIIKWEYKS